MKILQVIPYFAWEYGGPVKVVYDISRELAKRGHDVTIYTTDAGLNGKLSDKNKIKFKEKNIKIEYFKSTYWIANTIKLYFSTSMRLKIKKNLRNFDVVHLHEWRGVPHIYIWYYAKRYNIPYVIQAHGASLMVIGKQNFLMRFSKMMFDEVFGKRIINSASRVIALSATEVEHYKHIDISKNKIEIVPNGIDLLEYANLPPKGTFKLKHSIKINDKIILYLGRLDGSKGIEILLESFKELLKYSKNIKLVIAGPDYGLLKQLKLQISQLDIKDKTLITGPLYGNDKLEVFVDSEVFVTPTFFGFPMTFLESCATNTPIVTTNKRDYLPWIDDVGFVVDYDKEQLALAIYKVLNNDNKKLASKCKQIVKKEFNWGKIALKIEKIYLDSLK